MNELKDFHCKNRECKAPLGQTDGVRLYCGEFAVFSLMVTITCRACGTIRAWRPVLKMPPYNIRIEPGPGSALLASEPEPEKEIQPELQKEPNEVEPAKDVVESS